MLVHRLNQRRVGATLIFCIATVLLIFIWYRHQPQQGIAQKRDRIDLNDRNAGNDGCWQEAWPYGCGWISPQTREARKARFRHRPRLSFRS